jgi:hypothetical protein
LAAVHHLLDPEDAGVVRARDEVVRHTEVERDRRGAEAERGRERVLVEGADRVVYRERTLGQLAQALPLGQQLGTPPQGGADAAQGARLRDRGRELHLLPGSERRSDDGHLDAEPLA